MSVRGYISITVTIGDSDRPTVGDWPAAGTGQVTVRQGPHGVVSLVGSSGALRLLARVAEQAADRAADGS